ncbi:MAG: hypothetical protein R2747_23170 [Pyrinomonadaceae bacterium]
MGLIEWGKMFVATCSANADLEDLKKSVERGQEVIEAAKISSAFLDKFGQTSKKLEEAGKALDKVSKGLGKIETGCKDIAALMKIHEAISVLNDDKVIYEDPEKAAKAFGSLFVGFGTLAKHLPPPANEYAAILLGCGNFFADVSRGTVPQMRKNWIELERQGAFDH